MKYVALLRGVNVGGNNKVPMASLRAIAEDLGWTDVTTYIASGNLVFDAPRASARSLATRLESAIASELGVASRTLVLTAAAVRGIAAAIPDEWVNGEHVRTDVVYLLDGVTPARALAELDPREGIDHVATAPGALIWMVARSDATRSRLTRITGTSIYPLTTIRNANTARRLAALVAD